MDNQLDDLTRKEILKLLYSINYDYVAYRDDENYLCVAKIASILKYYGFSKYQFYIPARESKEYPKEKLDPIWEVADGNYHNLDYLYLLEDIRYIDDDIRSLVYFDQIERKEIEWLVPNLIPKGNITLISGNGGVGKGFVTFGIIKRITNNVPAFFEDSDALDNQPYRPDKVIYFTSEDDVEVVIKARIEDAGINQKYISTFKLTDPRFKDLKYDSPLLEKYCSIIRPKLVIFDPFQAFIDSKVNLSSRGQVREVLSNLVRLGSLYGTTFILISHTNKSEKRSGRGRIADSADLWDISRSVLMVGKTGEENIRYLSQEKNNYAKEQDTILFSINDGVATFEGTTTHKDDYYTLQEREHEESNEVNKVDQCQEDILEFLRNNNGQISSNTLTNYLEQNYSNATIKRAKDTLSSKNYIRYLRNQPLEDNKRGTIVELLKNSIN